MSASSELPLSTFAVKPVAMVAIPDFRSVLSECDRLQARINELKRKLGTPITREVPNEHPVALSEVLAALTARNAPCDTKTLASSFVKGSFALAAKPETEISSPS